MWTGMLNNKVGNFKFIYVDIIMEEEAAPRKIRAHRRSRRAKPKTLQELLERIHLQVSECFPSSVCNALGFFTFVFNVVRATMTSSRKYQWLRKFSILPFT